MMRDMVGKQSTRDARLQSAVTVTEGRGEQKSDHQPARSLSIIACNHRLPPSDRGLSACMLCVRAARSAPRASERRSTLEAGRSHREQWAQQTDTRISGLFTRRSGPPHAASSCVLMQTLPELSMPLRTLRCSSPVAIKSSELFDRATSVLMRRGAQLP